MAKVKQDEQLDRIGVGVTRLGEIARNMNEEVRLGECMLGRVLRVTSSA